MMQGNLRKMRATLAAPVEYFLPIGEQTLALNPLLGQTICLDFQACIHCVHCGKRTKKSYSQGHCFVCMRSLASCDMCIVKPETCHYHLGTCRQPEWGQSHCFTPHIVYLANTSGLKVGITRESQIPTRWIDQGATQALPLFRVSSRQISGLIEIAMAQIVADKTNWRKMLQGGGETMDLTEAAAPLMPHIMQTLEHLAHSHPEAVIERLEQPQVEIQYPVTEYPSKIKSHNFDKAAEVKGQLMGIKGQYLLLDSGVINIRKFTGYEIQVHT